MAESYSSDLCRYLSKAFPHSGIKPDKGSWLKFDNTDTLLYINGSKKYDSNDGWYDLDESVYNRLMSSSNTYQVIVLGEPDTAFVLSSGFVRDIFGNQPKQAKDGKRWMFTLNLIDSRYFLIFNTNAKHDITDYLNQWETIPEFIGADEINVHHPHKENDLEKLILSYDKNKEVLGKRKITEKESMELRNQFVLDFPADNILDIKMDDYVVGKRIATTNEPNRRTFCYRLEFGLFGFGSIGGVNAIKFGIYYSPKENKYIFNEEKFDSAIDAYKVILTQINMLIESGKQFTKDNDWKKLSDVYEKLDGLKSIVKSKILTVYFPNKIALINTENGIKEILKSIFHVSEEEMDEGIILKKKKLWELKESHPIMKSWSNFDYSYFVWYAWKNSLDPDNVPQKTIDDNTTQTNFWVVRAGRNGKQEDDALNNNLVTIHWHELSDLSIIKNKESLKSYYRKMIPNENDNQVGQGAGQVWTFLSEIQKSDIVILPLISKDTKYVAIGVILGDYQFSEKTPDIKHIRSVKWLHKEIPIEEFNYKAKKSLYSSRTVYEIQDPESLESIKEVMKKYYIFDEFVNVKHNNGSVTSLEGLSDTIICH